MCRVLFSLSGGGNDKKIEGGETLIFRQLFRNQEVRRILKNPSLFKVYLAIKRKRCKVTGESSLVFRRFTGD